MAPPGRSLADLPNIAIRRYEVTGVNVIQINHSIREHQRDAGLGNSAANWDVSIKYATRNVHSRCAITNVDLHFTASVSLPRLQPDEQRSKEVQQAFDRYLARIEPREAADLWFVYDRLPRVEKAVRSSSCQQADAAASAAVDQIKQEEAEFVQSLGASQQLKN